MSEEKLTQMKEMVQVMTTWSNEDEEIAQKLEHPISEINRLIDVIEDGIKRAQLINEILTNSEFDELRTQIITDYVNSMIDIDIIDKLEKLKT